jgi:hypothetical protein
MTFRKGEPHNPPLHAPLYNTVHDYSGEIEGFSILVELPRATVESLLAPTPFEFVAPYAWIGAMKHLSLRGLIDYEDVFGDPYTPVSVEIPARYGDVVGSYCALVLKNKDYAIAPGREGYGFPNLGAEIRTHKAGRVMTVSARCPTVNFELSVILDTGPADYPPEAAHGPTLLVQTIPAGDEPEGILLRQIYRRDTSAGSRIETRPAEGAFNLLPTPSGIDSLSWLREGRVVYAQSKTGSFVGALGEVLATEIVSPGLLKRIAARGSL